MQKYIDNLNCVSWKRRKDLFFLLALVSPPRDRFKKTFLWSKTWEQGRRRRKRGCCSCVPITGERESGKEENLEVEEEDVEEVNCRKLRGLDRGPVPVIPWGRNWGSVRMCMHVRTQMWKSQEREKKKRVCSERRGRREWVCWKRKRVSKVEWQKGKEWCQGKWKWREGVTDKKKDW